MIIEDIGCLLINNARSRAYLQKLLGSALVPAVVIYVELQKKKRRPESEDMAESLVDRAFRERKYFLYDPALRDGSLYEPGGERTSGPYASFDNGESVLETVLRHGLEHVVVKCESINDPAVADALRRTRPRHFVFGGGGILKEETLGIGKRFIHCHPGRVPHFRGSHCIEWSVLVEGRCAVTAFLMDRGIDLGDIIMIRDFDPPALDDGGLPPLYSAHIRSETLLDVVRQYVLEGEFRPLRQDPSEGLTYYKMHPALANLVLHRLNEGYKTGA
jgi:methionyl-tRNA formyltransferase